MSSEKNTSPFLSNESDPTHKVVDPYQAQRELERWLFNGENEDDATRRLARRSINLANSDPDAKVAFYIVHDPLTHDISFIRPGEPGSPEVELEEETRSASNT